MRSTGKWITLVLVSAFVSAGCTPHKLYRTDTKICVSSQPAQDCQERALQEFKDPAHPDAGYLLGFIEFDDQGQVFERQQMDAVLTALQTEAASTNLLKASVEKGAGADKDEEETTSDRGVGYIAVTGVTDFISSALSRLACLALARLFSFLASSFLGHLRIKLSRSICPIFSLAASSPISTQPPERGSWWNINGRMQQQQQIKAAKAATDPQTIEQQLHSLSLFR